MKFKKIALPKEIVKAIDAAMEEEKKHYKITAEMASASEIFSKSIINTADKYGENRQELMQVAAMGILQSCFDIDWDTFDPETGIFKGVK
jgi:hypothetical protein